MGSGVECSAIKDVLAAVIVVKKEYDHVQLTISSLLLIILSCAVKWTTWNAAGWTMGE